MHMAVDVGKSVIPKEERLSAVDEDVVEFIAEAKGIRVDLLHTGREVDIFQTMAIGKRMVTDVHDSARQGDTGEVDATEECFAANVANSVRLSVDGLRFRNDHITGIGVLLVVVDHDQVGLATTASRELLRNFAVIDAIDVVIIGKCTLANHHECQGQN